ncbi:MAG: hypothetical protein ABEH43_09125, partial [Flavobacteriales bacterium]
YWLEIPRQVKELGDMYESKLGELDSKRLLRINYRELCDDPSSIVKNVQNSINQVFSTNIPLKNTIPEGFSPSEPELPTEIQTNLDKGLR